MSGEKVVSTSKGRVKPRIIRELAIVGEAYQAQITKKIGRPDGESRKWMHHYFKELEKMDIIRSRWVIRSAWKGRKYYRLTQEGFNTLLDFHPKEAVMGLVREALEPIKSKVKEDTPVGHIHFDFLIENELGIRIVEGFEIPREIPNNISRNSDYVGRFLDPIRDGKLQGMMILYKLKTALLRLNNVLLIYTGHRPSEVKKRYDEVLKNVDEPLPDDYKYESVIEATIEMIKRSPKNVRFVFTGTEGLKKVKEVIKELLPT